MVDVPSAFNRVDFVGRLLPGYLIVTVYLLLFHFGIFVNTESDQNTAEEKGESSDSAGEDGNLVSALSFDILSAIIFVVAGPAVGYAIARFQRSFPHIIHMIFGFGNITIQRRWEDYTRKYAIMRLSMKEDEKKELDETNAESDFLISTGLGLMSIGIYYGLHALVVRVEANPLYVILLLASGFGLLLAYRAHKKLAVDPMIRHLISKY